MIDNDSAGKPIRQRLGGLLGRLALSRSSLSVISFASKIVTRAGTFLVIAPMIGPANQGTIVATSTWSAIILLIMGFGFQVRVLREFPTRPQQAHSIFFSDLRAMALALVLSVALYFFVAHFILHDYDPVVFQFMFVASISSVLSDYCSAALRGLGRYRREAALSFSTSLLQMGMAVAAALLTDSIHIIALTIAVSRALTAAASIVCVIQSETIRESREGPAIPVSDTYRAAFWYFIDSSLSVLLQGLDITLLTRLVDATTLGVYAVGSRLVYLFLVIPWIATNAAVPDLARREGTPSFIPGIRRLLVFLWAIATAGAAGLILFGPLFTSLVLGSKFMAVNAFWPSFAVLILARFFEGSLGIILTALGRVASRAYLQCAAIIFVGAFSIFFVPRIGPMAVVLAMSISYTALGLLYAVRLRDIGFMRLWLTLAIALTIIVLAVVTVMV